MYSYVLSYKKYAFKSTIELCYRNYTNVSEYYVCTWMKWQKNINTAYK